MNKKNLIIKIVTGVSLFLCFVSIFCCFNTALIGQQSDIGGLTTVSVTNVFSFMLGIQGKMVMPFGNNIIFPEGATLIIPVDIAITPILTVVFVLQITIMLGVIFAIVNIFRKKNNFLVLIVLALLAVTTAILALCSKQAMLDAQMSSDGAISFEGDLKIGGGIIAYAVLNLVGAVGCATSLVLDKKIA